MDYVINAQTDDYSGWINKGNNFLRSKYGAALYIIALIIVVLLYYFGTDFSSIKSSISNGLFGTNSYSTPTPKSGLNKGATIIIGISGLLVFIGIVLYIIRLYDYNNSQIISLVKTVSDGKNMKVFDKVNLPASSNRPSGVEFAYSTWLKINDWTYNTNVPKYIIVKGKLSKSNNIVTQAPSIQLTSTNTIRVSAQTYGSGITEPLLTESVELPNIPLKKWFHMLVAVTGRNIDIYINGVLAKRGELNGIVAVNNDPLYVCPSINTNNVNNPNMAGFGGLIYKLDYYAYYPSQDEIMNIVENPPNKDANACE
jgi:hypothetical protein